MNLRLVAAALRLGRLGDLVVRNELRPALVGRDLGERRGQRGLAVVDVPDGADVHVRFASIEFLFGHVVYDPRRSRRRRPSCLRAVTTRCVPAVVASRAKAGADDQDRTGDLVLTKDALCQLSYIGLRASSRRPSVVGRCHRSSTAVSPTRSRWLASRSSLDASRASEGWSGRRGSNPRPTAWKAVTLPLSYSRLRAHCASRSRISAASPPSRSLRLDCSTSLAHR